MNILINILLVIYLLVALLMMLVILMQRPKSEGLGAAFGGGVTENIFGAQTTNVLTKFTGWLAGIFFILTFLLSVLYAHKNTQQSALRSELLKSQPNATPAPAASGSPTASGSASPGVQPLPSTAVGAPGTVTNPTPAGPAPSESAKPADLAVGAAPVTTQAPPSAPPAQSAPQSPKP